MSGRTFLDTNVLVYSFDEAEPRKRQHAIEVLESGQDFVVSTQVLQEFYVTVVRKLARPLSEEQAEQAVRDLLELPVVGTDATLVLAAIRTGRAHRLSLWDALILQAAIASDCNRLLSEDLQDGFAIGSLRVENPFRDLS